MAKELKNARKPEQTTRGAQWIPSGATVLDMVVGAGRGVGFESGLVVNFPGRSSGGKSFVCCEIIANAYHAYGEKLQWVYDDCESGFTFDTVKLYGFEIMPFDPERRTRSKTLEEWFGNVMTFLRSIPEGHFGIYCTDSMDGLLPKDTDDRSEERLKLLAKGKDLESGTYGMSKPKLLSSEFLPKIAEEAERRNCLVLITSQLRDNVGAGLYAEKDKVSAGRALYFYSHIQLWTQQVDEIQAAGRQIGSVLKLWTKKAKGPRPYRQCFVPLFYEYGLDDIGANVDFLYDLRTATGALTKAAEGKSEEGKKPTKALMLSWEGTDIGGRQEMIRFIDKNNLERALAKKVINKWEDLEREAMAQLTGRKKKFGGGTIDFDAPASLKVSEEDRMATDGDDLLNEDDFQDDVSDEAQEDQI